MQVNFYESHNFDLENETLNEFVLEVDNKTYVNTLTYAIDKAGVPYGIKQIFGILFIKILKSIGLAVNNPFANGPKEYVCSELVAEILGKFGHVTFKDNLDTITPKMLFDIIKQDTKIISI